MKLTKRLQEILDHCPSLSRWADIGCDHGYLGIYLLQNGLASAVIASDVNQGPLDSAVKNAAKFAVSENIRFYLSDGVRNIPREFDTMVCAGMGADTMISILEAAPWLKSKQYRLILQCQSRRPALRRYLSDNGWCILRETLARDGKFLYPVMEVVFSPAPPLTEAQTHISPALLESNSPLLPDFFQRITQGIRSTVDGLTRSGDTEKAAQFSDVLEELKKMYENRQTGI